MSLLCVWVLWLAHIGAFLWNFDAFVEITLSFVELRLSIWLDIRLQVAYNMVMLFYNVCFSLGFEPDSDLMDCTSFLQVGLSVSKPVLGSIGENLDQPSPISVLELSFEEDASVIHEYPGNAA